MLVEMLYSFRDIVIGPHLDERRNTPRVRCNIPLSCQTPEGAMVCSLKDLSTTGARLFSDQKSRKNGVVILSPPKGMGEASKAVRGKVAWVRPNRGGYLLGIKFTTAPAGWVSTVLREMGLATAPPTQQRKFVRVPGDMNVKLQSQGIEKVVRLRDLSIGGALLSGREKLGRDQAVRITLPGESDIPELQLLAKACGCKKSPKLDGFDLSIKFTEMSAKQRKTLVKHLSYLVRRSLSQ
jgi:hypothetical protein